MRKIVSLILIIIMIFLTAFSVSANSDKQTTKEWEDVYLSKAEFDEFVLVNEVDARTTGLIASFSIGIKKSGANLIIAGTTTCVSTVVKCGFKEVVIQRRANSTQEWVDYVTYEDLYDDSFGYMLSKSITVGIGYQYRVTAVHYAKKNIFSTEKINNTSNTVVFA